MEKERGDHRPRTVVRRVGNLMTSNIARIVLLKRGIGSCKGALRRPIAFTRLLGRIRTVRKLGEVHFVASRPGSLSSRLVQAVTRDGGIYRRLRLPVRSKDDQVLGVVGHRCSGRGCLRLMTGVHGTMPSVSLAASVVMNFPKRARRSFRSALSIIRGYSFSSTFAFVCSGEDNAPTTGVRGRMPRSMMGSHFSHLLTLIRRGNQGASSHFRKAIRRVLMRRRDERGNVFAKEARCGLLIRFPKYRSLVNGCMGMGLSAYGKFCCFKDLTRWGR